MRRKYHYSVVDMLPVRARLLPFPFCKGRPWIEEDGDFAWVKCGQCGAKSDEVSCSDYNEQSYRTWYKEVIKLWNKRV